MIVFDFVLQKSG